MKKNKLVSMVGLVVCMPLLSSCSTVKDMNWMPSFGSEQVKPVYVHKMDGAVYMPDTVENEFVLLNTRWGERTKFKVLKKYDSANGKVCIKLTGSNQKSKLVLMCRLKENYWSESRVF